MTVRPDAKLLIDDVIRNAAGDRTHENIGPLTGDVIARAADGAPADVRAAIAAARRAFDETDWPTNHDARFALLKQFRDLLFEIARRWCESNSIRFLEPGGRTTRPGQRHAV
jgi:aldehyde dehydrogenase (NAD+)